MKLVVVTGASSGIGRATALRFAREGWRVVAVARTQRALDELQREAGGTAGSPGAVVVEAVDAGDGAAVSAMAARVIAEHGAPDVVVNSAGLGVWKYLEETSPQELAAMLGAPFFAAAHVTAAFLPGMLARRSGVLLHVGSPASIQPWPGSTAYATSRWALRGLHEALRLDLAGTGVSTCHVVFGEVTSSYFDNNPGSHEHIPAIAKILPLSTPEQCAEVLWKTAHRPRPQVLSPFSLWAMFALHRFFPDLFHMLVVKTGRKRLLTTATTTTTATATATTTATTTTTTTTTQAPN